MKKNWLRIDWWLLAPVVFLVLLSLTTLFSLSPDLFRSQLISVVLSIGIFLFFSQVDFKIFRQFALPMYGLSIAFLFIVLGIGLESHGAVRWLEIAGVRLQFSEIIKPFLSLSLASFMASRETMTLKTFVQVFLFALPVLGLIYLQPDLGNAIIFVLVILVTLLTLGFPVRWFIIGSLPILLVSPIIWTKLHDYQRQRILTFLHPSNDPTGSSYNVIQAMIAVGSGKIIGRGFSEGSQSGLRFLPERHTDFIFATISEGVGFVGSLLIVGAFAFLCGRIARIFMLTEDMYTRTFSLCALCFILIHAFVNIGMNIGIVPVVGVTLPFVSYGGNSFISNSIFLGILSAISVSVERKDILEIK